MPWICEKVLFKPVACTADPNLEWDVSFTEFAHPAIETFSAFGSVGPTFLLAAAMFGFVIQISNLVTERELKLRQVSHDIVDSLLWLCINSCKCVH